MRRSLPCARRPAAADAAALLRVLRARILAGEPPAAGPAAAAVLIGLRPSAAGYIGGLCRRIDRACRDAGLPPLATAWVCNAPAPSAPQARAAARARAAAGARSCTDADLERLLDRLAAPGA